MEIFGYEINRAQTAAEKKKEKVGLQIGDSGTPMFSGVINDEYNSRLAGTAGITVYDEMRRSDGTVKAAIKVCELPIRSAKWYVEPASEAAEDAEIADFVWKCFSQYQSITWNDTLRHALLSLPFGVMAFEKVYAIREVDGATRIVWEKLAPRMPRSIQKWAIAGDAPGITQQKSDGKPAEIPLEKLIVIVNEKEGGPPRDWGVRVQEGTFRLVDR
jgi:hypothetical protein